MQTLYTVGCVSYVNAIPLVKRFEDLDNPFPVDVLYDVPSRLPAMLAQGTVDAILVSSVDALSVPGRRMAAGICIGSDGPVKSVRLFSKVDPREIRTLALDASSLTSNRLAQIILAERYGVRPTLMTRSPKLASMLADADACVLIGDIGMAADGAGLLVLDLGEEWQLLTSKPFVWAAWIGGERLTSELADYLRAAAATDYVGRHLKTDGRPPPDFDEVLRILIDRAQRHAHWGVEVVRDYYLEVMVYSMDKAAIEGLHEFQRRLLANGFNDCSHFPTIV